MAIRLALTAFVCWLVAFACITWGQVRVLRAQRYAESAAGKYASTLLRAKIAELTRLNHELDFHMRALRSSYPRLLKTNKAKRPSEGSSPHRDHTPEVAQVTLRSPQDSP